jgi:hypothetical protein
MFDFCDVFPFFLLIVVVGKLHDKESFFFFANRAEIVVTFGYNGKGIFFLLFHS